MRFVLYLFCLAAVVISVTGCRSGDGGDVLPETDSPPAIDPRSIELGEDLYALHCADCHGVALEGEADWKLQNADGSFRAPPHDASGHTWHHSDAQLIDAIRLGGSRLPEDIGGISHMPGYHSTLTEREIVAVLDYIKSKWPEEQRQYQWDITRQTRP